jgi:hypothetical protein
MECTDFASRSRIESELLGKKCFLRRTVEGQSVTLREEKAKVKKKFMVVCETEKRKAHFQLEMRK